MYANAVLADLDGTGLTVERILQSAGKDGDTLTLKDQAWRYAVSAVPEMDGCLLILIPQENLFIRSLSQFTYTNALMILLLFGTVVSASSVGNYIRKNALPPDTEQKYSPRSIRRIAALFGVIGVILIAICGWLDLSLNSLYDFSVRSRNALEAVEKNIGMNAEWDARDAQKVKEIYLHYGNKIADILNDHPEARGDETLKSLCGCMEASSITLYDPQGKETACSRGLYRSGAWDGAVVRDL